MTKTSTIRRLASEILSCGKNKVWLDPNETLRLTSATTRSKVASLISDNLIIRKPNKVHSRFHTRKRQAEVAKGRHRGPGKVRGSKNALFSLKRKWIIKIRELRDRLSEMRDSKYITASEHKTLYLQAKGNMFKGVVNLNEYVEKKKSDEKRMKDLEEQAQALRIGKNK